MNIFRKVYVYKKRSFWKKVFKILNLYFSAYFFLRRLPFQKSTLESWMERYLRISWSLKRDGVHLAHNNIVIRGNKKRDFRCPCSICWWSSCHLSLAFHCHIIFPFVQEFHLSGVIYVLLVPIYYIAWGRASAAKVKGKTLLQLLNME